MTGGTTARAGVQFAASPCMSFIPNERTAIGLKRRWFRQLSLRHKAWLLTAMVLLALMLMLSLGISGLIRKSFQQAEERVIEDSVARVREIFRQHAVGQLRITYDYAVWDDTYRYVRTPFAAYRESNFSDGVLRNLEVDAALLFQSDGQLALGYRVGGVNNSLQSVPEVWVAALSTHAVHVAEHMPTGRAGLLALGDQLAMVSFHPVLRSDGTGPQRGCFVHVALIGPDTIARAASIARQELTLQWPPVTLVEEPNAAEAHAEYFQISTDDALSVIGVRLPGLDGSASPVVELRLPRDMQTEARGAMRLFYTVLLVVLLAAGLLIARALRWLVLQRVERIHSCVVHVGETADLSTRLPERQGDELDGLALGFNRMLDALEQARHAHERAEMEREQLREHLLHAKKMEAIGTLAGGIAHDFNNLITGFLGSIELMRYGLRRDDPALDHLARMEDSALRAGALVKQLLALGRSQSERRVPLHLGDVVADALRLSQSGLPGTIDLRFRNEAVDDRLVADVTQLQQVVMNLVTNASQAMAGQPTGIITVTISAVKLPDSDNYPETALLASGDYLRLSIADNGHGIAEHIHARIFDPFFTTKPVGSGSGLGLAVAHGFATKHHGSIGVRSTEGQGATFTLHLPCPPETPAPAPSLYRRPLRLLLVDDDLLVRATLGKGLARAGHVVTEAGNAHAALRLLKESPNGFDAVITDQLMPGMTGVELMRKVAGLYPELPVVLISGYMTELDAAEAAAHPQARLLRKPISLDELDRAVREVVPGK